MMLDFDNKTKPECREYAKNVRSNLDIAQISSEICNNFQQQDFYKFSENILSFYPFNSEVDLRELYKDASRSWYLPRVDMESRGLIIHQYRDGDSLVKNKWGVYEPYEGLEEVDPAQIDIAIIPALMVDKRGIRLGYGAGFYDRFIPGLRKNCLKIVTVPEELFVKKLPCDHWDIPVNKVITEKDLYSL